MKWYYGIPHVLGMAAGHILSIQAFQVFGSYALACQLLHSSPKWRRGILKGAYLSRARDAVSEKILTAVLLHYLTCRVSVGQVVEFPNQRLYCHMGTGS